MLNVKKERVEKLAGAGLVPLIKISISLIALVGILTPFTGTPVYGQYVTLDYEQCYGTYSDGVHPGKIIFLQYPDTAETCRRLCRDDPTCKSFVYFPHRGVPYNVWTCWLNPGAGVGPPFKCGKDEASGIKIENPKFETKPSAPIQTTPQQVVCRQLTIVSTSPLLPTAIGWDYTYQMQIKGGNEPLTILSFYKDRSPDGRIELMNGMPPGLTLSSSGLITGQPKKAGNFPITIRVIDQCPLRPRGIEKEFYLNIKPQ